MITKKEKLVADRSSFPGFSYIVKKRKLSSFKKVFFIKTLLYVYIFFSHGCKSSFPYLRSGSTALQRSNSEMSRRWKIGELHRGLDVTGTRVRHSSR